MADLIDKVTNAASDALAAANRPLSSQVAGLSFPSDLGTRHVSFQQMHRNRETTRTNADRNPGAIVLLPIPTGLSTGYNAQYSQDGLGVLGNQASQISGASGSIQSAIKQVNGMDIADVVGAQVKAIAASASVEVGALLGGLAGGFGAGALGAAGAGIAVGALQGAGKAVNPHLAVLFQGVNFRTHSFQYKFSPRSSQESSRLKQIVYMFKNAMHPTTDGLAFFDYPDEFNINFPNDGDFLFDIGTSVLTDFQINYAPDGGSYFHQNGAPVSMSLSLQFTELDILTKTEIDGGR